MGIGGMFFRAENPEVLREWYADNLATSGLLPAIL
jgi:hypothetical protein